MIYGYATLTLWPCSILSSIVQCLGKPSFFILPFVLKPLSIKVESDLIWKVLSRLSSQNQEILHRLSLSLHFSATEGGAEATGAFTVFSKLCPLVKSTTKPDCQALQGMVCGFMRKLVYSPLCSPLLLFIFNLPRASSFLYNEKANINSIQFLQQYYGLVTGQGSRKLGVPMIVNTHRSLKVAVLGSLWSLS